MNTCVDFSSHRLYEPCLGVRPRIKALITRTRGERMVREKRAEEGKDFDGSLCFMLLKRKERNGGKRRVVDGVDSPCVVFSKKEVDAIAGTNFRHGRSRTARMSEEQRLARKDKDGVPLPPEDVVERALAKQAVWSQIGGLLDVVRVEACL